MKKTITIISAALLCLQALAQKSNEDYLKLYNNLVSRVGYDGVGVETILNKWQQADSLDINAMIGRFNYLYVKGSKDSVTVHPGPKYLGNLPAMSLKDSLGNDVKYFTERFFDENLFGSAMKELDKAISIAPNRMDLCALRADALLSYEKESPDMAYQYLTELINSYYAAPGQWEYDNVALDDDAFCALMQEYCFSLYNCGSASGYEAFRSISQIMTKHSPNNPDFINNIGSYYTIVKKNDKAALKYYKKALKIAPDNVVARQNITLIERRARQKAAAGK